jgi:putative flippase GtrA
MKTHKALVDTLGRAAFVGQLARFSLVGVSNTAISFVVYLGLDRLHTPSPAAAPIAFLAGALNGYWWNARWTFAGSGRRRSVVRYGVVQGAGAGASSLLVFAGKEAGLSSVIAFVAALVVVTATTFVANRYWSFGEIAAPATADTPT